MSDSQLDGPVVPSSTEVSRRSVLRTGGAAAWLAPVVVTATAAPAYAISTGIPAVIVSGLGGVRNRSGQDNMDCTATFTNEGAGASALSVDIDFAFVLPGGLQYGVKVSESSPWTASPHKVTAGGMQVTFTRAGGLAAGAVDELTWTFTSISGTGNLIASPPVTSPTGTNSGTAGIYGDP